MAERPRRWLMDSIRRLLLPAFEERGFVVVPLTEKESRSELRSAFPFGRLRRPGPNGFEMVEIQLHKHGGTAFRLNVGIAPPGGIVHIVGPVAQEDIWVHYLDQYYAVYQCALIRKWFSFWRWPGRTVKASDYDELIKRVVKLIPEIERALREGKGGLHVKKVG